MREGKDGGGIGGRDESRTYQVAIVEMKYIYENEKAYWIEELWIERQVRRTVKKERKQEKSNCQDSNDSRREKERR